jgi:hypothetical protein
LYSTPSKIGMNKSRRMRWAWHVTQIREKRNAFSMKTGRKETTRKTRTLLGG